MEVYLEEYMEFKVRLSISHAAPCFHTLIVFPSQAYITDHDFCKGKTDYSLETPLRP